MRTMSCHALGACLLSAVLLMPTSVTAQCPVSLILCGQTLQGSLTTAACNNQGYYYAFPSYSQETIGAYMVSPDFAVGLILQDSAGNSLDFAVAGVGQGAVLGDSLTSPGIYDLVASPLFASTTTGNYSVSLLCDGKTIECNADPATLCLQEHRFRIQVGWHNQFNNTFGFGRAVTSTDSVGFFSFGDPSNIELLIKILNFGGTIKVFYGELTNLQFEVAITDMDEPSQPTKTYTNTPGDCGGIDENFDSGSSAASALFEKAAGGGCKPDKNTICLLNKRFALTMNWHNQFNDTSGVGGSSPLSDVTGAFYFTDRTDLELVAKIIDFGDRIAVFYGSLSDLQYSLTVTDTLSGVQKIYTNPPGTYCGGLDNTAFP